MVTGFETIPVSSGNRAEASRGKHVLDWSKEETHCDGRRSPAHGRPWPQFRMGVSGALAVLFLLSGCAYFNTFYHARRFYKEAERTKEGTRQPTQRGQTRRGSSASSSNRANDLYRKCIEKCQKVIKNYPGSKWQDDAHLLMAKAYYGKGDYLSARRELDRYADQFPDSNLLPEAMFWRGLTAYAQEDYEGASEIWKHSLDRFPKYKGREETEYYLCEARRRQGDEAGAVEAYRAFLQQYPKGKRSISARLQLGKLLLNQHDYKEAETIFTYVANKAPLEEDRFEARLRLGEVLEAQDRYQEALDLYVKIELGLDPNVFDGRMTAKEREAMRQAELAAQESAREDSLLNAKFQRDGKGASSGASGASGQTPPGQDLAGQNPQNPAGNPSPGAPPAGSTPVPGGGGIAGQPGSISASATGAQTAGTRQSKRKKLDPQDPDYMDLGRVMLREGTALAKLERPWDAILAYEQVMADYPRTPLAAEAQYRIGYTFEVDLDDFDEAQKAYKKVGSQGRSSFTEDAMRRAKNLETVKQMTAAPPDSASEAASAAAEGRFLRAELYLFQQDKPERALQEYESIEEDFAGTDQAAKAGLAVAWVRMNALQDTARGRAKYLEVMRRYPDTEYGRQAARILKGPEREPEETDFAGPTLAELQAPENIASVMRRDSLATAQLEREEAAAQKAVRDSLNAVQAEAAQAAAAAGAGNSAGVPEGGNAPARAGVQSIGRTAIVPSAQESGPTAVSPPPGAASDTTGARVAIPPSPLPPPVDRGRKPLPRGPSGSPLDPFAIPVGGWTPVLDDACTDSATVALVLAREAGHANETAGGAMPAAPDTTGGKAVPAPADTTGGKGPPVLPDTLRETISPPPPDTSGTKRAPVPSAADSSSVTDGEHKGKRKR